MHNPEYLIIYEVTCPECGESHHLYGWQPRYCVHCGNDIGGCSKDTLRAQKHYFKPAVNPLTGVVDIVPDSNGATL
jgi:acetone carboxylase gamma subunit